MEELKGFTNNVMNLDKSDNNLLPNETREVHNYITDKEGYFTKIKGNTLLPFTLPAGENTVIGSCNDYSRHAILYLVKNSLGNHSILRFRGNKIDRVVWSQPVLNFVKDINHANVISDLMYWTDGFFESFAVDGNNPPRKINFIRAIGSNYPLYPNTIYEKYDVVNHGGKVYEFIGDVPGGNIDIADERNWRLIGRKYDNLTQERLYWILDRIKYPLQAEAPVVYYTDNPPAEAPVIVPPPSYLPYGYLYNWDALFELTFDTINYGLLYNWYAATDARLICADGWEVPEQSDFETLDTYLGITETGLKLKESGFLFWLSDVNEGNNLSGFNGRGVGARDDDFYDLKAVSVFWSINEDDDYSAIQKSLFYNLTTLGGGSNNKHFGFSIRPIKTTTALTHGQTGTYTGNDGKVYRTICIGTQEWLADNLCETKFRNGDYIPGYDGGVYTPFTNSAWAALTTAGVCCYNDDTDNI